MNIEQLRREVSEYIAENKIQRALNLIGTNDALFKYSKSDIVLNLQRRLNGIVQNNIMGMLTPESYNIEMNKIINAISSILDIKHQRIFVIGNENQETNFSGKSVSLKEIKSVLSKIKDKDDKIDYYEAIDCLSDLF
jgi:hypothetical protein